MFYIMSEVERESFTKCVEVNGDRLVMFVGVLSAFVSGTIWCTAYVLDVQVFDVFVLNVSDDQSVKRM